MRGSIILKLRSSSSDLTSCIPSLSAKGEKISKVSKAICFFLSTFLINWIVLILCKRSANLTNKTLISFDVASNNFLKFSACLNLSDLPSSLDSFVTPSTK